MILRAIERPRLPPVTMSTSRSQLIPRRFEHNSQRYHKAFGHRALVPKPEPMTEDTVFDAASLTKVIACTPAMMLLIERGKVKLDEPVQHYIPEFTGHEKETITVRQLMTH